MPLPATTVKAYARVSVCRLGLRSSRLVSGGQAIRLPHANKSRHLACGPCFSAGARTDDAPLHTAALIAILVALRPRVVARSPMSGAALRRRRRPGAEGKTLIQSVGASRLRRLPHERLAVPAVRSGSRGALERIASHTGVPIATFRRDAPARCGAFADGRRSVVGRRDANSKRTSSCSRAASRRAASAKHHH
jgi:hypothetical protein